MPTYIVKLSKNGLARYFVWSTIVDAPTTYGMTLAEFLDYYRDQYRERGMEELPARLVRVAKTGCSAVHGDTAQSVIKGNRCAEWEKKAFPPKPPIVEDDGETHEDLSWTFDEIWEFYVERRDDDDDALRACVGDGLDDEVDKVSKVRDQIRDRVAVMRSVLASMPFTAPEVQPERWARLVELNEGIGQLAEQIEDDDDKSEYENENEDEHGDADGQPLSPKQQASHEGRLLLALHARRAKFEEIQQKIEPNTGLLDDCVYRFWHQSFKVFYAKTVTHDLYGLFNAIANESDTLLHTWLSEIVDAQVNIKFDYSMNVDWSRHTRPVIDAFLHTTWILGAIVRTLKRSPTSVMDGTISYDWATILCVFTMRE